MCCGKLDGNGKVHIGRDDIFKVDNALHLCLTTNNNRDTEFIEKRLPISRRCIFRFISLGNMMTLKNPYRQQMFMRQCPEVECAIEQR